jgi:hypothetical protein
MPKMPQGPEWALCALRMAAAWVSAYVTIDEKIAFMLAV